jgi:hypothetical protein
MGINLGSLEAEAIYLGELKPKAIYLGSDKVWPTTVVPPLVTNGLILYFNFAEPTSYPGTGSSLFDLSGNNYTGTIISNGGTVTYNPTLKSMTFIHSGNLGGYVNYSTGASLVRTASSMSYCMLVRPTLIPFGNTGFRWACPASIDNFNQGPNARKFTFYFYNPSNNTTVANNFNADFFDGAGGSTSLNATSSNWLNQNLYIVATIASGTNNAKLYINGTLVATQNGVSINTNPSNLAAFATARFQTSFNGYLNGELYTQHVYNRVLSQAEVIQNYAFLQNQFNL